MSKPGGASPDGISGSLYVGTSAHGVGLGNSNVIDDLVHSAVRSTLKGVTINGASPNMIGSRIEFDVPLSVGAATLFPQVNPQPTLNATTASPYSNFSAPPTLVTSSKNYDLIKNIGAASIDEQLKYFSRKRLKGESRSEYKDRQQEIRDLKRSGSLEGVISAVQDGDSSYFYKSYVPVLLPRADGKCTTLLGIDITSAFVIEDSGLSGRPNLGTLPDSSEYYTAGIPRGCPYDLKVGADSNEEAYLSAVKHSGCDSNGMGNNSYELYAAARVDADSATFTSYFGTGSDSYFATTVKHDESSFWGYDPSGYNFKTVASNTQTLMELWESNGNYFGAYTKDDRAGHNIQNGSSFFGAVVQNNESSIWGYAGVGPNSGPNYMLKSTTLKADLQLWSSSGPTVSAWAQSSTAGVKVENATNYSFLDMGQLWMKLANAEFHGYGGGLYIKNTSGKWVDIQPPAENCYFQSVLLGDMTNRYVLCSDGAASAPNCANLPAPKVGNIEAMLVTTPSYCGPFSETTTLDLTSSKLTYTGGSDSAVYKLDGVYINSSGDGSFLDKKELNMWESAGASFRAYASGMVRLNDGQGGTSTYTPGAFSLTQAGGGTAALTNYELSIVGGSANATGKLYVGGLYLNDGSNHVTIVPPYGEDAYFQSVKVCVGGQEKTAYVLMSTPQ
jgi:hypothetical protein